MAKTPSTMIPLGTQAPDFCLPDVVSGRMLALSDIRSPVATVVMFICNHCPFVKHIIGELSVVAAEYGRKNISFVAINSNDVASYPDDSPEHMKEAAGRYNFTFPYLYDESQNTARAYQAACTPDFYVFDGDLKCVYRGQFDDARPDNGVAVTGKDIRLALNNLLSGEPVIKEQIPSLGCNIKWKS